MLVAGDEMGRTQAGNNNAYCQDNDVSWLNWELAEDEQQLQDFVKKIIHFRLKHPTFRRRRYFQGRSLKGADVKDLTWITPKGEEMSEEEWNQHFARCIAMLSHGEALEEVDDRGNQIIDDNFLLILNAHHEAISFKLPVTSVKIDWRLVLDTSLETGFIDAQYYSMGVEFPLQARALVLFAQDSKKK